MPPGDQLVQLSELVARGRRGEVWSGRRGTTGDDRPHLSRRSPDARVTFAGVLARNPCLLSDRQQARAANRNAGKSPQLPVSTQAQMPERGFLQTARKLNHHRPRWHAYELVVSLAEGTGLASRDENGSST